MRKITRIIIHCTATHQDAKVDSILRYWKTHNGWTYPGYHYLIDKFGNVHNLLPIEIPSNGVKGYNAHSIHISYIGGITANSNPIDNRTDLQKQSMKDLIDQLLIKFPDVAILGHRDMPNVTKSCPSFDVAGWLSSFV